MPSPEDPLTVISDRLNQLQKIKESVAQLPDEYRSIVAKIFRAIAEELSPEQSTLAALDQSPESAVQRLAEFFRARSNRPATLVEMSDGTGIPYVTVRTFLYKRHRSKFAKVPMPSGRSMLWQWADLIAQQSQEKTDTKG